MSQSSLQVSENHGRKQASLITGSCQGGVGIAKGKLIVELFCLQYHCRTKDLTFLIYHAAQPDYLQPKNLDTRKISAFIFLYVIRNAVICGK